MRVECKTLTFLSFWTFRKRRKSSLIVSSWELDKRDWVYSLSNLEVEAKHEIIGSDFRFFILPPSDSSRVRVFAFKTWDLSAQHLKASETAVPYLQEAAGAPWEGRVALCSGYRFCTLEKGWGEWSLCKKPVSRGSTATGYRRKSCCDPAGGHLAGRDQKWLENSRCRCEVRLILRQVWSQLSAC